VQTPTRSAGSRASPEPDAGAARSLTTALGPREGPAWPAQRTQRGDALPQALVVVFPKTAGEGFQLRRSTRTGGGRPQQQQLST